MKFDGIESISKKFWHYAPLPKADKLVLNTSCFIVRLPAGKGVNVRRRRRRGGRRVAGSQWPVAQDTIPATKQKSKEDETMNKLRKILVLSLACLLLLTTFAAGALASILTETYSYDGKCLRTFITSGPWW